VRVDPAAREEDQAWTVSRSLDRFEPHAVTISGDDKRRRRFEEPIGNAVRLGVPHEPGHEEEAAGNPDPADPAADGVARHGSASYVSARAGRPGRVRVPFSFNLGTCKRSIDARYSARTC